MSEKKLEVTKVEFDDPGVQLPWRALTQRFQMVKPAKNEKIVREGMVLTITYGDFRVELPFTRVRQITYAAPAEKPKEARS